MRKPQPLRAQAITWLAQREHSERELRVKLLRRLQAIERLAAADSVQTPRPAASLPGTVSSSGEQTGSCPGDGGHAAQVDAVIGWLTERGYLDEQRFVASRVHVRADRFGVARIEQELSRHGLDLPPDALHSLRSTELERARAVWQRRFGSPPVDIRDAARQARFLAGRGFSGDVVRRVIPRFGAATGSDREAN